MAKKGLTSTEITRAASEMIAEVGYERFSLRELALKLGIQPASLYHHFDGINEISMAVSLDAAAKMNNALTEATEGLERDEAFLAALSAYRSFAEKNPELYKALFRLPANVDKELIHRTSANCHAPLRAVVASYELLPADRVTFLRAVRAFLHGFVTLSRKGFLGRSSTVIGTDESFDMIAHALLDTLKQLSEKAKPKTAEDENR